MSWSAENTGYCGKLASDALIVFASGALQNHDACVLRLVVGLHMDRDERILDLVL